MYPRNGTSGFVWVVRQTVGCVFLMALSRPCAIALEIVLPPLSSTALTSRLGAVCRLAGVRAEARSLSALCDVAGGDIRSCLSTLQFSTM